MRQLMKLWLANPHVTFGQLVSAVDYNLRSLGVNACMFYADDKDVKASIDDLVINYVERQKAQKKYEKALLDALTSEG